MTTQDLILVGLAALFSERGFRIVASVVKNRRLRKHLAVFIRAIAQMPDVAEDVRRGRLAPADATAETQTRLLIETRDEQRLARAHLVDANRKLDEQAAAIAELDERIDALESDRRADRFRLERLEHLVSLLAPDAAARLTLPPVPPTKDKP